MAHIRATCDNCGDIDLISQEVHLHEHLDYPDLSHYSFRCPHCGLITARRCNPKTYQLLQKAAVKLIMVTSPKELRERESHVATASPITGNDVLDFHNLMEKADTIEEFYL